MEKYLFGQAQMACKLRLSSESNRTLLRAWDPWGSLWLTGSNADGEVEEASCWIVCLNSERSHWPHRADQKESVRPLRLESEQPLELPQLVSLCINWKETGNRQA